LRDEQQQDPAHHARNPDRGCELFDSCARRATYFRHRRLPWLMDHGEISRRTRGGARADLGYATIKSDEL
jgi:hypothetical protein